MYGNYQKQIAFQDALNCLYNGYGRESWDGCGLDEYEADEVWEEAERKLFVMCFGRCLA